MQTVKSLVAAILLVTTCSPALAMDGAAVCLDQRVRKAVAELVGTWSENFAFSKVLIGPDGKFGNIEGPALMQVGRDGVVCRGTYRLSKASPYGSSYALAISDVQFQVEIVADRYSITLINLPLRIDTEEASTALINRFTVNQRPYREILDENQAHLNEGGR